MSDFDLSGRVQIDTSQLDQLGSRLTSSIGKLGAVVAGAFAVDKILEFGKAGLKVAADYQNTTVSFEGLLGSADKAHAKLAELRDFANKTPFEMPGLAKASQQLLAVGFSSDDLIPTLTKIGNVASATGNMTQQGIGLVVRALGQMKGKGKVSAEEINQIAESLPGFNAYAAISAATGKSVAVVMADMAKGALSADVGIAAILKGMEKFPGAAGAMQRQSETLNGALSNFRGALQGIAIDFFTPYLPTIARAVNKYAAHLQNSEKTVKGFLKATTDGWDSAFVDSKKPVQKFAQLFYIIGAAARTAQTTVQAFFDGWNNPSIKIANDSIQSFAAIVGGSLSRNLTVAQQYVDKFHDRAAVAFAELEAGFTTPALLQGADAIGGPFAHLGAKIRLGVDDASLALRGLADDFGRMGDAFNNPGITSGVDSMDDKFSKFGAHVRIGFNDARTFVQSFFDTFTKQRGIDTTTSEFDHFGLVTGTWVKDVAPKLNEALDHMLSVLPSLAPYLVAVGAGFAAFKIGGTIASAVGAVGGLISVIGLAAEAAGGLGAAFIAFAGPVLLIAAGIALLVAGVIYAYQHFQGFRDLVGAMATYFTEQFGHIVAFAQEIWPQLVEAIGHVLNVIMDIVRPFLDGLKLLWSLWGDDIMRVVGGVFDIIKGIVAFAINTIANVIRLVLAVINGDWGRAWDAVVGIVRGVWDLLYAVVKGGLNIIAGIIGGAYAIIQRVARETFNTITGAIGDVVGGMFDAGTNLISGFVKGIKSVAGTVVDTVKRFVIDPLPQFVKDALGIHSPSRVFEQLGKQIPAGFARGILGGAGDVTSALATLTSLPGIPSIDAMTAGAISGTSPAGGSSSVVIGDIHLHGVKDADGVREAIPELVAAIRAGVG